MRKYKLVHFNTDDIIKNERLKILLQNAIVYIDTELFQDMMIDRKIEILMEELGLTEDEVNSLDIKNYLN